MTLYLIDFDLLLNQSNCGTPTILSSTEIFLPFLVFYFHFYFKTSIYLEWFFMFRLFVLFFSHFLPFSCCCCYLPPHFIAIYLSVCLNCFKFSIIPTSIKQQPSHPWNKTETTKIYEPNIVFYLILWVEGQKQS